MAQKYIIGDVVMYNNEVHTIIDILASNGYELSYVRHPVSPLRLSGVPITPEILEKNGWNKSIGWSYVGSEERGYQFSKELDDKWDELDRMTYGDLQICQCENLRDWSYINECNHYFRFEFTYVHELQHLLYALHIDSNLKI